MIAVDIPGWGDLNIENVVFDLNGTLARDGKIPPELKEKVNTLSEKVKVYILTADTQGTASKEIQGLQAELVRIPEATVAIGNGNNDQLILKESGLGIAILEREGMSVAAMKNADMVVKDIFDAFDLLLKPKRLIATLRE
jgi:soluble P-type ATPase